MALRAVHVDLREHRERDAVACLAERLDLALGPGLLAAELVAREAEHDEAAILVLFVQLLEAAVVRGQPALRGDVHDERDLARVVAERLLLAVDRGGGEVVQRRHARLLAPRRAACNAVRSRAEASAPASGLRS